MHYLIIFFFIFCNTNLLFAENYSNTNTFLDSARCENTFDTLTVNACDNYISPGGDTLTQSGTYLDTLLNQAGCDSIITIHLMVFYGAESILEAEICKYTSYDFHGTDLTQSGVYRDTLSTQLGCDSIVTLDLTVSDTLHYAIDTIVCSYTTYTFNGMELTQSGIYRDTMLSRHGCDSIVTLILSFQDTLYHEFTVEICENGKYVWNGDSLTQAGVYKDTLTSQHGCDSIVTLNLWVEEWVRFITEVDICEGEVYPWNGTIYDESTFASRIVPDTSGLGCDSFEILILTVHPHYDTTFYVEICSGTSYTFDGQELYNSGTYKAHFLSQFGCDSFVTLNLLVTPPYTEHIMADICIGTCYIFDGRTLCDPGSYIATFQNPEGCDSIVTLELSISAEILDYNEVILCPGEVFECHNEIISEASICYDTLTAVGGCDSIIVHRIQPYTIDSLIRQKDDTLFADWLFAEYQWMYCDSQDIAGADQYYYIPSQSGQYAVEIRSQGCVDTTDCIEFISTGLWDPYSSSPREFKVYPKPSGGTITFSEEYPDNGSEYWIIDTHGVVIKSGSIEQQTLDISELPNGIYLLRVQQRVATFVKM